MPSAYLMQPLPQAGVREGTTTPANSPHVQTRAQTRANAALTGAPWLPSTYALQQQPPPQHPQLQQQCLHTREATDSQGALRSSGMHLTAPLNTGTTARTRARTRDSKNHDTDQHRHATETEQRTPPQRHSLRGQARRTGTASQRAIAHTQADGSAGNSSSGGEREAALQSDQTYQTRKRALYRTTNGKRQRVSSSPGRQPVDETTNSRQRGTPLSSYTSTATRGQRRRREQLDDLEDGKERHGACDTTRRRWREHIEDERSGIG